MVGVVSHFQFATPSNRKYKNYIQYMARDEAQRKENYASSNFAFDDENYDNYNKYMSNPEKASGLFNNSSNQLSFDETQALKRQFQEAQNADSNMWQIVVSFDNEWLKKFGAYDPKNHKLNETVVMDSARNGMLKVLQASGMENAIWSGAIHYNTDNIHIHLAIVEPTPSKEKKWYKDKETNIWKHERPGYMPYKAIDHLKSQVANHIADRSKIRMKTDELSRSKIGNRHMLQETLHHSYHLNNLYHALYKSLPENKQLWKYNNNAMLRFRPMINEICEYYIEHFHHEEFHELNQILDNEMEYIKETYGQSKVLGSRDIDYKKNKIHDLYAHLGNTVLKDLSAYDKVMRSSQKYGLPSTYDFSRKPNVNLNMLKRSFYKSHEEIKRQQEFERLQWEIEHDIN